MSKIYKLFINENIKTWKKFSTKLAIIFIILALVGALGLVKVMQKIAEKEYTTFLGNNDWKEDAELDIKLYKEQLLDETLSEIARKEKEAHIKAMELNLKYDISIYSADWKNTILRQLSISYEIDENLIKLIENDDFSGYIKLQKEEKKQQLEKKQITQEEYDDEILLLNLSEKYGIGKSSASEYKHDWRTFLISDIRTAQQCIRTGIDIETNKVLTVEQKEKYDDEVKIGIYRIENDIKPIDSAEDNFRMMFEVLAPGFVISMIALFVIIVAGGAISNEISTGTIKFWALTPNKRWKILTAKILSILFYIVVITLVMAILTVVCANIFFDTNGNEYLYVKDGNVQKIGNTLFIIEYYFSKIISVVIFALFALMLSVITRNTSIALALSVMTYMGNSVAMMIINSYVKKDWIKFIPFNNLNVADKIFPNFENPMSMMSQTIAPSISLGFSLAVVGVCAILMIVTMYDSFNNRDII